MTRIRPDQLLLPSVLDRLIDDDPKLTRETPRSRSQLLFELKQSVRRDLQDLLNTRICLKVIPRDLKALEKSLINYGIPDIGGLAMGAPEKRETLRKTIEDTIKRYETRFKTVRVELVTDRYQDSDRTIRFKINGMLYAEPEPEPVVFDSQLIPASQKFEFSKTFS